MGYHAGINEQIRLTGTEPVPPKLQYPFISIRKQIY